MCASRFVVGGALVVMAVSLAALPAWAQVTVYEKAPSVEELQQKLLGGEKAEQRKFRTRAIVFEGAPAEAVAPPAQPNSQSAPSSAAGSAAHASAASAAQRPAQTMQVSDNAIAFPIQFRINSAQILPESVPFLESMAGLMQKDPGIRLLIEGHTDVSGSYQRNMVLSRERAFSVMNYLIDRYRIDPMRLVPVGKGSTDPLPGHEPTDPKNRRVQFRIIG